jgi:SAM-dependent methyltransferase
VHDDGRRWDERHGRTVQVDARPPEAIEHWPDLAALLPQTGRCLDLASGPGAVTLWLAEQGLEVKALDVSTVAIELLRAAARAAGVAERVDARIVDLDDGIPDDVRDVDLVVCQRFRDTALYPTLIERLRSGGIAIVTVLSIVGSTEPGPFHAPQGELLDLVGSDERCEIVRHHEGDGIAHMVVCRR